MKIKNKLENKILGVIFLIFFMNVNILFAEIRDNYSDTWVGTDGLGRVLPTNTEVGNPKTDKTVGLFYYIWMHGGGGVYDNTKIIAANPNNPEWGPLYWWHWWGEPWLGYYNSNDDFVIKKHAQMLADAGVDVIIFDNTNAITYQDTVLKLCNLYRELKANGCRVPKIMLVCYSGTARNESKKTRIC